MNNSSNVLVTCGGKWVGHVLQLKQAMRNVSPLADGKLFVADCAKFTPAGHFADGSFVVPPIDDPQYIDALIDICRRQSVRVLVPLIDLDVMRLSAHHDRFAEVGTSLRCPPANLAELCFDKEQFDAFAASEGVCVPRTYRPEELDTARFPLFCKPRQGFGSIGSGVCSSLDDARKILREKPDMIFQQCIEGPEISIDGYIASTGRCIGLVQRVRDKVIGGESYQTHTVKIPKVHQSAMAAIEALARLGLTGSVVMQVFDTEEPPVIDVNPRIGSATLLSNVASGGRLLEAILTEGCGLVAEGDPRDYREGVCLYRYLGHVVHDGASPLEVCPPKAA